MSQITQTSLGFNIKNTREIAETQKDVIKSARYITDKYLPGHGVICELNDKLSLIRANAEINRISKEDTESMIDLGMSVENQKEPEILGFNISEWKKDIKTRLEVLHAKEKIKACSKVEKKLKKHLSASGKLSYDLDGLSDELDLLDM